MLMNKKFQHTLGTKGMTKSAAQTLPVPGFPLNPEDPGSIWPPFARVGLAAVSGFPPWSPSGAGAASARGGPHCRTPHREGETKHIVISFQRLRCCSVHFINQPFVGKGDLSRSSAGCG